MMYHVPKYVSSIHLLHYPCMLPNIPVTGFFRQIKMKFTSLGIN